MRCCWLKSAGYDSETPPIISITFHENFTFLPIPTVFFSNNRLKGLLILQSRCLNLMSNNSKMLLLGTWLRLISQFQWMFGIIQKVQKMSRHFTMRQNFCKLMELKLTSFGQLLPLGSDYTFFYTHSFFLADESLLLFRHDNQIIFFVRTEFFSSYSFCQFLKKKKLKSFNTFQLYGHFSSSDE